MQDPPYDRAFALAAQVTAMRDHYLEVRCGCGARRVIALGTMAEDANMPRLTLASVAAKVRCAGCWTGPDEVHLTATIQGLEPAAFGGDVVWSIPLRCQERRPSYHYRRPPGPQSADAQRDGLQRVPSEGFSAPRPVNVLSEESTEPVSSEVFDEK